MSFFNGLIVILEMFFNLPYMSCLVSLQANFDLNIKKIDASNANFCTSKILFGFKRLQMKFFYILIEPTNFLNSFLLIFFFANQDRWLVDFLVGYLFFGL